MSGTGGVGAHCGEAEPSLAAGAFLVGFALRAATPPGVTSGLRERLPLSTIVAVRDMRSKGWLSSVSLVHKESPIPQRRSKIGGRRSQDALRELGVLRKRTRNTDVSTDKARVPSGRRALSVIFHLPISSTSQRRYRLALNWVLLVHPPLATPSLRAGMRTNDMVARPRGQGSGYRAHC